MDRPLNRHTAVAIRPEIAALPENGIVEVVNYGREMPGVIPLWVGEGDLPTPDFIADAAVRALREGRTFYTYQRGIPELRRAIAAHLTGLHGIAVDPERVIVTASGMQAVQLTMQALIGPGDEVVHIAPVWPNLPAAVQIMGGVPRQVPLQLGRDGWQLDLDRVFAACGPRTRAVFVNSPANPTGWIMSREEMRALRDFARARGLWIVSDEVYSRLVYDAPHAPSFLEIMAPEERLVVVNTFSKNWAMTGWRVGWLVAPAALGQVYENLVQFNTSGTATFLQYGAVAAIRDGEEHVRGFVARCRRGRELVCDRLAALPRLRFVRPAGAFYLFFAVEGEPDTRALALRLIDQANVGLAPGTAFGAGGAGFLRLCFALSAERLALAMDRLAAALR